VETRELVLTVAIIVDGAPRPCQRGRKIGFFVTDVPGPVTKTAGLDQHDEGVCPHVVDEDGISIGQPWQPRLHAVEELAVGEPFPVLAPPRFGRHELTCPFSDVFGGHDLSRCMDDHFGTGHRRALVIDAKLTEAIDFIAPQVDANRSACRTWEYIDDGTSNREVPSALDLRLAPIPRVNQHSGEVADIDLVTDANNDWFEVVNPWTETLHQRTRRSDDDLGRPGRVLEPPQNFEATSHGFDVGADALERQCLPSWEDRDVVFAEIKGEVGPEALGFGGCRHRDHDRGAFGLFGDGCERERTASLGYGNNRRPFTHDPDQAGVVL